MARWQRNLDIAELWKQRERGEITIQELSAGVSQKLRSLRPFRDERIDLEREAIADEFEEIGKDADAGADDFDIVMERLYDWADTALDAHWNGAKVCWVDILGRAA